MFKRHWSYLMVLVWGVANMLAVWFAYAARTGNGILSPWQTIPETVIYLSALSLLCLGVLIVYAPFSIRTLLVIISVQTLVIHSFTPLSQQLFFGADGWRHIASVERLLAGLPLTNVATNTSGSLLQNFSPGFVAYSHLWLLLLIAKYATGISLIALVAWLGPLVWSLVVPSVLYKIGEHLSDDTKTGLLLAVISLMPFALNAGGSFTLPNSLGFILFLPSLGLLLKRLENTERRWLYWLSAYGIFLVTGYTLYALIFFLLWGIAELIKKTAQSPYRSLVSAIIIVVFAGSIPFLEVIAGYSQVPASLRSVFKGLQQAVGNFSGFYFATGPRPHAIATGNILLNQTSAYAFVPNIFTEGRYWLVLITCGVWFVGGIALYRGLLSSRLKERWLAVSAAGLFGSYVIGRYIFVGEQILSRRLDMTIALFLIILIVMEGRKRLLALNTIPLFRRYIPAGFIVLFAGFTAAILSLGPTDRAMSVDEYQAATYVWSQVQSDTGAYCVLGETYPLLALEAISAKRIVGGGFPIDQYFGQYEREELYARFLKKELVQKQALHATNARRCLAIGPFSIAPPTAQKFGTLAVWQLNDF